MPQLYEVCHVHYQHTCINILLVCLFSAVTLAGTFDFKGFYVAALNTAGVKVGTFTVVDPVTQAVYCDDVSIN